MIRQSEDDKETKKRTHRDCWLCFFADDMPMTEHPVATAVKQSHAQSVQVACFRGSGSRPYQFRVKRRGCRFLDGELNITHLLKCLGS